MKYNPDVEKELPEDMKKFEKMIKEAANERVD